MLEKIQIPDREDFKKICSVCQGTKMVTHYKHSPTLANANETFKMPPIPCQTCKSQGVVYDQVAYVLALLLTIEQCSKWLGAANKTIQELTSTMTHVNGKIQEEN